MKFSAKASFLPSTYVLKRGGSEMHQTVAKITYVDRDWCKSWWLTVDN